MSMVARSSDLDNQKSGVNVQTKDHIPTPPSGQNSPEETEAIGSAPSHSLSQSLARMQTPDCPEAQYCLEIQVSLTKDGEIAPPPHMPVKPPWCRTCSEMGNWEIRPHRSGSDRPQLGHPLLWMIPRRRA